MDRPALHTKLDEVFPNVLHCDHNDNTILVSSDSTINDEDAFDVYDPDYESSNGVHPDLFNLVIDAGWYIDYHDATGDFLIRRLC